MPINYVATYYKTIIKNNSFIYIHGIGNSMFPLLNENMQLKILKKETYEKGDLVLYSNGSRLILHRIIEINTIEAFRTPEGEMLLNCYGLCSKERREWRYDFFTRLETDNLFSLIKYDLSEKDKDKININKRIFLGVSE